MRMTKNAAVPSNRGVGVGNVSSCIGHKTFEFLFTILIS